MCWARDRRTVVGMTETTYDTAPPPPPDTRRLTRDPDDRVVAGVCAGLGRYTGTDPVLWRVTVAVLAVFGGAGVVLYVLGWLLIPRVGEPESWAERNLRNPDRGLSVVGIVLLVLTGVLVLSLVDEGPGLGVLLVAGAIAYLVLRDRRDRPPAPLSERAPSGPAGSPPAPPQPGRAPRERSALGGITLSLALLVTGVLLAVRASGVEELTVPRVLAVTLLVLGTGLLVGTVWGRARWLLVPGVVVALALGVTATAENAGWGNGVGERSWRAVDGGSYSLGAGEGVLDLRGLRGAQHAEVEASIGFGHLVVLVPSGMSVSIDSSVGIGEITAEDVGGPPLDRRGPAGRSEQFVVGSSGDVTIELDLQVGFGEIEVRRVR
jgi:phage shock protein PspC (stress-responsive transcriptional regulator)